MDNVATVLWALEKPLLVILAALVGALFGFWVDRFRARNAADWWEAQERWRFRAQVYTKALVALKKLRGPFELASMRNTEPGQEEISRAVAAAQDLIEPSVIARIWLPEEATKPLETLGSRVLQAWEQRSRDPKQMVQCICEIVQTDIERLQGIAREDLCLRPPRQ